MRWKFSIVRELIAYFTWLDSNVCPYVNLLNFLTLYMYIWYDMIMIYLYYNFRSQGSDIYHNLSATVITSNLVPLIVLSDLFNLINF